MIVPLSVLLSELRGDWRQGAPTPDAQSNPFTVTAKRAIGAGSTAKSLQSCKRHVRKTLNIFFAFFNLRARVTAHERSTEHRCRCGYRRRRTPTALDCQSKSGSSPTPSTVLPAKGARSPSTAGRGGAKVGIEREGPDGGSRIFGRVTSFAAWARASPARRVRNPDSCGSPCHC